MKTKEELAQSYTTLSDRELLDIINDKHRYTDNAISAATEEITKRDIDEEKIRGYIESKVIEAKMVEHVALIELTFFEKAKFFFLWLLPFVGFASQLNLAEDGLNTKVKQSKIFSSAGFLTFLLTGGLAIVFKHSNFVSISIWILFFFLTFAIEKRLKKPASIK